MIITAILIVVIGILLNSCCHYYYYQAVAAIRGYPGVWGSEFTAKQGFRDLRIRHRSGKAVR